MLKKVTTWIKTKKWFSRIVRNHITVRHVTTYDIRQLNLDLIVFHLSFAAATYCQTLIHSFRFVVYKRRGIPNALIQSPFGKDSFVQIHHDGILRFQLAIEEAAHVTVGSNRVLYVTSSSPFGSKFNGFEPFNVLSIEKHISDDGRLRENPVGMPAEYDSLSDDPIGIDGKQGTGGDQLVGSVFHLLEGQDSSGGEGDGRVKGSDGDASVFF